MQTIFGGAWNNYDGEHFGEVIWARYASNSEIRNRYYEDYGRKTDFNVYSKTTYQLNNQFDLYVDLQYRTVTYKANGVQPKLVNDTFHFFNPKAGITHTINQKNQLYFSYAKASREPNRNDYENGNPKPEKLHDLELGWRFVAEKAQINTNMYYMKYQDQLVLTGALNDVGAPIRTNSGKSYRLGLEIDAKISVSSKILMNPNLAVSTNKNIDLITKRNGVLEPLGNTHISYSPSFIAGNSIQYQPVKNLQITFLSKYVGEQYMSNIDAETSKLENYFINDFNFQYTLTPKTVFKTITINGLINNIFNVKYVSNGYYYTFDVENDDETITTFDGAGYYPQAGIHFLMGVTLQF